MRFRQRPRHVDRSDEGVHLGWILERIRLGPDNGDLGRTSAPQQVPAGGTLEGEHNGEATVESGDSGAAVVVETAAGQTTVVRGINIRSRGGVGLLVRGDGAFVGIDLNIDCEAGFGVAAQGQGNFALSNTDIRGNVTYERVPGLGFPLDGNFPAAAICSRVSVGTSTVRRASGTMRGSYGPQTHNDERRISPGAGS